jgi:hypothetical protein
MWLMRPSRARFRVLLFCSGIVTVVFSLFGLTLTVPAGAAKLSPTTTSGSTKPRSSGNKTTTSTTTTSTTTTTTTSPPGGGGSLPLVKDLGVQPGGLTREQVDQLLDTAKSAGTSVVAAGVSFAALEPTSAAPVGEWSTLDAYVTDARARGMRVRFQVYGLPDWARDPGDPGVSTAPWLAPHSSNELGAWSSFLQRLVTHFGTNVAYYEIWNEPNIEDFWWGGPSPSGYAALLHESYTAINGVNSQAKVMFGGLSRNDLGFLQQVYASLDNTYATAAADRHYFDILNVHPYTLGRSPTIYSTAYVWTAQFGLMDENFTGFSRLKDYMASRGEGSKHIYIGEYGFPTQAVGAFPAVSDSTRALYLADAYSIARSTGYVEGLCWYYFYPTPWDGAEWTLLDSNGNGNLTFDALVAVSNG